MTTPSLPLLAAACVASGLLACTHSSTGPEPLGGEAIFLGDYEVSGDTLILHRPSDTELVCEGTVPEPEVREREPDTNQFALDGDVLRLFQSPDTFTSGYPDYTPVATMRRYLRMIRVSGSRGLEGRWQVEDHAYEVLSGTLQGDAKARREEEEAFFRTQLEYLTVEYEFSGGQARGRLGGDHAGLFLAEWNGDLETDSLDAPDSAEYDIRAVKVNPGTVRLTGGKTGETVTVTFVGPLKAERFTSDNPEHPAYSVYDAFRLCIEDDWYPEFLEANRKAGPVLKPGAENAGARTRKAEKPRIWSIFTPSKTLPLNRPESLLN